MLLFSAFVPCFVVAVLIVLSSILTEEGEKLIVFVSLFFVVKNQKLFITRMLGSWREKVVSEVINNNIENSEG